MKEILKYFTKNISEKLLTEIENGNLLEIIEEIRIRLGRVICLKTRNGTKVLDYIVQKEEMEEIIEKISENSIYTYQKQLSEGFITIKGGHRIGLTGSCVIENGKIVNIKNISSLNFRIARQINGCSDEILRYIVDDKKHNILNTMIISAPGCGKTTILRDIVRQISSGIEKLHFEGKTVGIVDERGEIAAMFKGTPQNDIGLRTDVIENVSKSEGMRMLIRSMAPEIIACDEIGSNEDVESIKYAITSGVKGIFTAHGENFNDIKLNPNLNKILENKMIERMIFLSSSSKGKFKTIYGLDKKDGKYYLIKENVNL